MTRKKAFSLLVGLLPLMGLHAQDDPEYRMEIGAGVGVVNYEGDYNGSIFGEMQPMGALVGRYIFNPHMGLRLSALYGKIKGSTDNAETWYPDLTGTQIQRSQYSFSNPLVDVSLVWEYNFWPYGTGRDYRGSKRFTPYAFIGLGATWAKCDNDLEGQSTSAMTANVPVGIGVKYKLGERVNLGVQWGMHFSLSDALDGAEDPYGIPSSGLFKNTDCYSTLSISLTYSFSAKCKTCNKE